MEKGIRRPHTAPANCLAPRRGPIPDAKSARRNPKSITPRNKFTSLEG